MATPDRAADCHAHVFGDPARYPYNPDAHYTPDPCQAGTAAKFLSVLDAHAYTHGLLVGAAPYLTDNRCLLDSIANGGGRLKGIALVHPAIPERDLAALNDGGVVGIRINLIAYGLRELTAPGADRLLARLKEMNWFVQVHCEKDNLAAAAPILRKAGVRVMIDHFGRPDIKRGISAPGFQTLLEFGKTGNAVVKLSGPFRCSLQGYPYDDVDPYIEAAIEAYTLDNCVWGSDWPYVLINERMDYGPPLVCLRRWLPDMQDRQKVLWDTPARLFGFI